MIGGREEIRTPDPLLAKQVLSQLSYTPINWLPQLIFYHLRSNFNRTGTRKSRNNRNNNVRNGEAVADPLGLLEADFEFLMNVRIEFGHRLRLVRHPEIVDVFQATGTTKPRLTETLEGMPAKRTETADREKVATWIDKDALAVLRLVQTEQMVPVSASIRRAVVQYLERMPNIQELRQRAKGHGPQ